eukprot:364088-Rhodomonas_salina.3
MAYGCAVPERSHLGRLAGTDAGVWRYQSNLTRHLSPEAQAEVTAHCLVQTALAPYSSGTASHERTCPAPRGPAGSVWYAQSPRSESRDGTQPTNPRSRKQTQEPADVGPRPWCLSCKLVMLWGCELLFDVALTRGMLRPDPRKAARGRCHRACGPGQRRSALSGAHSALGRRPVLRREPVS